MGPLNDHEIEPARPNPPRWWWVKRLLLIAFVPTLGLGIAWKWWAHEAQRRVDAEVAAIRARGEPLEAKDFEVAPVPDELNAALSIFAAIGSVPASEQTFIGNLPTRLARSPLTSSDRQGIERVARLSTTMRSQVRTARFQHGLVWSTNVFSNSPVWLNETSLPRTLLVDALHEHLAGNDAEAIEILRDMIFVTDSFERPKPSLIMHLLALVNGIITFDAVALAAPDLQIMPQDGATTQPTGPASRQQVAALIRALLDDQDMQRGLSRGFQLERAHLYSALTSPSVRSSTPASFPAALRPLAWPSVQLDLLRTMQSMDEIIAVADSASLPTEKALPAKQEQDVAQQTRLTATVHALSGPGAPKFGARLEQQLETLAGRRIAAIRLAIRLYQLDHDGSFPTRLEELVPAYLPTLPLDTTTSGQKPFDYRKSSHPTITTHSRTIQLAPSLAPATTSASSGS